MIIKPRVRGFMCITTHPTGCDAPGGRCKVAQAFSHTTWRRLGFSLARPTPYQVQLLVRKTSSRAVTLTLRAIADFDCDGRYRELTQRATLDLATGALRFGELAVRSPQE